MPSGAQTNTAGVTSRDRTSAGPRPDARAGSSPAPTDSENRLGWVPIGAIVGYSGVLADLPPNWLFCDGTNDTPDLRNLCIIGANDQGEIGDTGGSDTHTHDLGTLATASVSAGTPAGSVSASFSGSPVAAATTNATPDLVAADATGTGVSPVTTAAGTVSASFAGSALAGHTHTFTGALADATVLPPYYKLAWIKRMS